MDVADSNTVFVTPAIHSRQAKCATAPVSRREKAAN
jgi:hypothetical protein